MKSAWIVGLSFGVLGLSGCWEPAPSTAVGDGGVPDGAVQSASCEAQDARGEGACRLLLGVVWDGTECVTIGGCECVGADCLERFESLESCQAAYGQCIEGPATCEAQDARGEGACRMLLGVVWDGTECVTIGGCECVGADCASRYATEEACLRAHASCGAGLACDPNEVWCRAAPPVCPAGQVPSVVDHCWGECVDAASCAPIACSDERFCPEGMRCTEGVCR